MADHIACPKCGEMLRVLPTEEEKWLTCPHCLASISNPNLERITETPPQKPAEPAPRWGHCPTCGEEVRPGWRFCPNCEERLDEAPPPRRTRPSLERDTGVDMSLTGMLLILFGLIGGIVYVLMLCGGAFPQTSADTVFNASIVIGFVLIVVVTVGIVLNVRSRNPQTSLMTGMLGGLTIGFIVLLLLVASVVYAVDSCLKDCNKSARIPSNPPAPKAP